GRTALIDHELPEFSLAPHESGVRGYSPLARYFAIAQAPVPERTLHQGPTRWRGVKRLSLVWPGAQGCARRRAGRATRF
ncbi:MAG: hypothetical protein ABF739_12360, partial [Acetobacter okinawensis]|uniref:hypothetical protein n=1 Tax=Acetobacter okinawensis TaxID=1076594 RepID=UPI0039E7C403